MNRLFFGAYLDIGGQRFVGVLEAMPVLSTQSEGHAWQAEGTVLGDLRVHRLSPRRVRHREVLIQQLLGDNILQASKAS